jgi:hypothetical protein
VIHYNPDDPFVVTRVNWDIFRRAIPAYDVHLVPRQPNVAEYLAHGARHVLTFDRGYSPTALVPPDPHDPRWSTFATDVAFTGTFEAERAAGGTLRLAHLYTVHEERLQALAGPALQALHRAGYLQAAYMAMASLSQFRELIERQNRVDRGLD